MAEMFKIAIVGSGPGGLCAGARAAELGLTHILLEAAPHTANTVYQYRKGKYVMDEPAILPLRSSLPFAAGDREAVLQAWDARADELGVNIRHHSEAAAIAGQQGDFSITLKDGEVIRSEHVVLAIGLQGNIRKLDIPGEDLPFVQYRLADPEAYADETIMVIGAGDSAIEDALALAKQNTVILLNRRDEFARARQANFEAIQQAVKNEQIECHCRTTAAQIEYDEDADKPGLVEIKGPEGRAKIRCHRIIVRIGATPPREFVEACGVVFPKPDPASVPLLNASYESNVSGLYIIGALAGYPLIKQAMNQGYEVVECIAGRQIEPADEPLLREKFKMLPAFQSVNAALNMIQYNMLLLAGLTKLQLREFLLESEIRMPEPGDMIFRYNDYTSTFFCIISGEVRISISRDDPAKVVTLRQGQFFGEIGLISGRRRTATVYAGSGKQCVLIETPRRTMSRLINSVESVKRIIDKVFVLRAIQANIAPEIPASDLAAVVQSASIQQYSAGEALFHEGDINDSLHLVRLGSLTVSRNIGGNEIILSYLAAGNYVGEMALLSDAPHPVTVRAAVTTETIRLNGRDFKALLSRSSALRHQLEAKFQERFAQHTYMEGHPEAGNVISFLVAQGLGEGTDVLLIDESLCVRCDNCENACAETHGGTSRLDRDAGPSFASVHVPTSCRHCEHPHCMKDCPPDAIHRAPNGEVYIADNCIGCGKCQHNCPYRVIQMAGANERKPGLLTWLLFGLGPGPGKSRPAHGKESELKAVKCDMCKDLRGGPACVRACPTAAASRVTPEKFMSIATP